MSIEIDLQAKRCPGGYADITEPKGFIDEVEVIMEAFARGGFQRGVAGLLVMPGAIGGTGLHGREDMDQAGMITALGEDGLDTVFFAKGLVATDELGCQTRVGSQLLGMVA